jgi:hypothetical protein
MKMKVIRKPTKPDRYVLERQSAVYNFNWVSKKVAWSDFQDWVYEQLPGSATDITLELVEEWMYDDCTTYLELSWNLLVPNSQYEKELKKYEKAMVKWKKS